jgi:uncharacterized protein (DUF849 family)
MLIKACLNGSRTRSEHPAVPISHAELALDAHHAMVAGAGAVHVHPRAADGTESLEPHTCGPAIEAIRRACPGFPVGVTTAAWIELDLERRLWLIERWEVLPDFASVNLSEEGAGEVCAMLDRRGIGIEAGLSSVDDARRLAGMGIADRCLRLLVEIEEEIDGQAATASAEAIDRELDQAGVGRPRLHHGFGVATWAVLEAAVSRGRDIRIGLEDTLVLPEGRIARDNAELVRRAATMVGSRG